jgi:hypothetical protein
MRHLYRNTASGAEAAGSAHGAHGDTLRGAHPGCVLYLDYDFYATCTRFTKIKIKTYMINFFAIFSESPKIPEIAQKWPKWGEFLGILKWWKIHSHAVSGLRISGFLSTTQNGPFYYK